MLRLIYTHIPWNGMSTLGQLWSDNALRSDLVLPSASTLSNICWKKCSLTGDAIKKQLPSIDKASLALQYWTLANRLAIMTVIANYMDRILVLVESQLAFDESDTIFCSYFES